MPLSNYRDAPPDTRGHASPHANQGRPRGVQDINERKLAEQALRESEERFRGLAMLTADWYWEQDEQFRFVNFSGNEYEGPWRPDQVRAIGLCRWELDEMLPVHGSWDEHRATLAAHLPFRDFQYARKLPGQPLRYVSCSGEPVFDAAGLFRGYRGTARDITSSKLMDERLHDARSMLGIAARIGRLGGWVFDVAQRSLTWSHEVRVIHEVAPDTGVTMEQALRFHARPYRAALRKLFLACRRHGTPFDMESQIVTATGARVWVRVIGEAELDAQGRVRRIQGACQDITESRQIADDAQLVAEQLTTTLESLTDAFVTIDRSWRFTYINAQAEHLLRQPRSVLLGQRIWTAFPAAHDSVFGANYKKAMAGNVTVQFEGYYEPYDVWLQVKVYPSSQGLAIYVRDVTERFIAQREILRLNAELEERVRQRTAQLETANKELEAFSYSIAHDLRGPLSSIDGFSRMLETADGLDLPERHRHYLQRIRNGVRHMGELTDGLLALANLSRAKLRREPVDLAVIASAALASCHEREPARLVHCVVAPSMPVSGDSRLLAQVMLNLLGNAWKFSARRAQAEIQVGMLPDSGTGPVYFVRDNGAGFDMAHSARLFQAFERLHSATQFEGTGIGLALVRKVVQRHGGRIWAESAPGEGATFYFTLGEQAAD